MKPRTESMIWNIRNPKTTNQNNKKKKESKKPKDSVTSLRDDFKHSNICIIGMPEGEEMSKKLEIYLKK